MKHPTTQRCTDWTHASRSVEACPCNDRMARAKRR
eukprot:CAMPEP_0195067988 /NCGR_PEP_ID=MMETSP0448-20130528/12877_1 /TAXON_ID=66468 /ORGANISM="Heterocapsa triquestra, Strain CCMP 448" /LENGTH=34 /DNA_ID= /DNA_START= /DNA_END= /DNA_ORIENTATION=